MQDETKRQPDSFGTGWKNEPDLNDLIADYDGARNDHDFQSAKITSWLDNLHVTSEPEGVADNCNPFNSSKSKVVKGKSTVKPKLIRKQAEWRYTSLSEPFLNTPDIFNVDPVTFEDAL